MAKVVYDANGKITGVRITADEEKQYPIPVGASVIEFDTGSNMDVLLAIRDDYNNHQVVGGALRRSGQLVTIAADSTATVKRKQIKQLLNALDAGTASSANQQKALAFLIREHFQE